MALWQLLQCYGRWGYGDGWQGDDQCTRFCERRAACRAKTVSDMRAQGLLQYRLRSLNDVDLGDLMFRLNCWQGRSLRWEWGAGVGELGNEVPATVLRLTEQMSLNPTDAEVGQVADLVRALYPIQLYS